VPVRRVVPDSTNCLGGLEDQTVAATRSWDVRGRDLVNTPIRAQRVDEAKPRIRHLTFDSLLVDFSRPWDVSVNRSTRAVGKSIHVPSSCFAFQALNAPGGNHDLVQIAIGMARGRMSVTQSVVQLPPPAATIP